MNTIHDENKIECPHGNWFSNCDDCSHGYKDYILNKIRDIRNKTIDECIACVAPNADIFMTGSMIGDAPVVGYNLCRDTTITNLSNLKNNG